MRLLIYFTCSTIVFLGAKLNSWFPGTVLPVEVKRTVAAAGVSDDTSLSPDLTATQNRPMALRSKYVYTPHSMGNSYAE